MPSSSVVEAMWSSSALACWIARWRSSWRTRDRRRRAAPHLRALLVREAVCEEGHWTRTLHLQGHYRGAQRNDLRRQQARSRHDILDRDPARGSRRVVKRRASAMACDAPWADLLDRSTAAR